MTSPVHMHEEVLTPTQQETLARLGPELDRRGFVLAGGTAVALLLGHRKSVDLDWVGAEGLDAPMDLAAHLAPLVASWEVLRVASGTLHASANGVRVSLLEYRYAELASPIPWRKMGIRLASLDDLCAMKLAAVAQRGSRKDFWDVYALALRHKPLARMMDLYRRKFGISDLSHVLYGLTYFDDAEREPEPEVLWDISWAEVREALLGWVRDAAHRTVR